jgi:predicted Rdx family selenoprotein
VLQSCPVDSLTSQTEGGFPELKILKQRIRNIIQPELNLGHSDAGGKFKS